MTKGTDPQTRFWAKVEKTDACWLWRGAKTTAGYGEFYLAGASASGMIYAHRLSWEWKNGPILAGLHVCHSCDTPACVRPDHLFLGTPADNMRDMSGKGRGRKPDPVRIPECGRGHKYTPENTYIRPDGRKRECRTCKDAAWQRWYRQSRSIIAQSQAPSDQV